MIPDLDVKARALRDAAEAFLRAALAFDRTCAIVMDQAETSPEAVEALGDRARFALAAGAWSLANKGCEHVLGLGRNLKECSAAVHGPELAAAAELEGCVAAGRIYTAARAEAEAAS